MLHKRARLLSLVLAAGAIVALAGCSTGVSSSSQASSSSTHTSAKGLVVGVAPGSLSLPIIAQAWDAMKAEAKDEGITLKGVFGADSSTQDSGVRTLISQGVDALILNPYDSKAIGSVVQAANTANIPVVMMIAGNTGGGTVASHVGADETVGAKAVAKYVLKQIGDKGKIAYIQGDKATTGGSEREKGFRQALKEQPNVDLVGYGAAAWSATQAQTLAQNMLAKNPDIKAILTAYDGMSTGAAAAVSGASGKVLTSGIDGECQSLNAIWKGTMTATDDQLWTNVAVTSLKTVVKATLGKSVKARIITPSYVIDKTTMQQIVAGTYDKQTPLLTAQIKAAVAGCNE